MTQPITRRQPDDPETNPNSLHDFHQAKRGAKNVPPNVMALPGENVSIPKDPGHPYAQTKHIKFDFYDQRTSNAAFGYEHFVSLPPKYDEDTSQQWPLILFLHGAGESQRGVGRDGVRRNDSFLSIRHGIPKVILCYDKLKSNETPAINIDLPIFVKRSKQAKQADKSVEPVPPEVCTLLAENFITVTPSLNMEWGYGWNASVLSALLDEIVERYRVDLDRIHVTGLVSAWVGDHLRVSHIKHIPQWIHHGDLDDIIPVQASQKMARALEHADAPEVKFSRYPELRHDSWTEAYNNPEVYRWMLQHKRTVTGDEEAVPAENKVVLSGEL
ncbi:hypothetical protein EDD37DRAFT_645810 [Exophiala viscosa]|uniref:uncharacterized protein n=1 Tax=Exophiala viscosa TaxID=2486360 RepID=UPI00218E513B|nr:hypothetical protein EDD37DRAFT_645810 [Exophiala viscosa]